MAQPRNRRRAVRRDFIPGGGSTEDDAPSWLRKPTAAIWLHWPTLPAGRSPLEALEAGKFPLLRGVAWRHVGHVKQDSRG